MQFSSIILGVLASITAVQASAGTICTGFNFGDCTELGFPGNFVCSGLGDHYVDSISSFTINPGFACAFYDNVGCNDNQGWLDNQRSNVADLRTIGWNDRIASYKCAVI